MFHIPEMPATGTGGTGGANRAASGVSFVDREGCDRSVPAHPGNGIMPRQAPTAVRMSTALASMKPPLKPPGKCRGKRRNER